MSESREKLQDIFRDQFDDDGIVLTDATSAKDIAGWDSLANIKLIVRIEKAFKIRFSTGELVELNNVGELLSLIDKKLKAA
jgi:acyl carrier protein